MDKRKVCQFVALVDLFFTTLGVLGMLLLLRILFVYTAALPDKDVILRPKGVDYCIYQSLTPSAFNVSNFMEQQQPPASVNNSLDTNQLPVTFSSIISRVGWVFVAYACFATVFTLTLIINIYGTWKLFRGTEMGVTAEEAKQLCYPWRMINYVLLVFLIIVCIIERSVIFGVITFGLRMLAMFFVEDYIKEVTAIFLANLAAETNRCSMYHW